VGCAGGRVKEVREVEKVREVRKVKEKREVKEVEPPRHEGRKGIRRGDPVGRPHGNDLQHVMVCGSIMGLLVYRLIGMR
jgi:hypothetical protein